ncbi:helix-turn-helix transcriptional regulator [Paenibacillus xylaniclasticus]|uniref:helix-turn-helix transcriptional regulator n=1 Tax=Paenibacillus xylaniclasticus TaxID=588083 RepID=UPI000FDB9332|nr:MULTISPECIES: AraC family transcriptional regulator [Paenibacillus]GFN32211.1 hypothetical protein PCURB6_24710 [Paenibacillus curdlanolyticus]
MDIKVLSWKPDCILHPGYIDYWHLWEEGSIVAVQVFNPITLLMRKKKISLQAGEVVLISNKHKYIRFHNESSSYGRLRGLVFYKRGLRVNRNFCKIASCSDITATMNRLFESNPFRPEVIQHLLDNFIIPEEPDPSCTAEALNDAQIDNRLIKLNRYIRKNYANPNLTLGGLSDLIKLNPTYISNCYSRVFKRSPIFHLNTIRINHAIKLLESEDLKIIEIANRVGYSSAAQFSSMFRRYYDMSPSEYRSRAIR